MTLGLVLAFCAAQYYGIDLADAFLPLVGWAIAWSDDHYRLISLQVATQGADTVFQLRVSLARPLIVGNHMSLPHPLAQAEVTTTVGTFLQPSIVLLELALAWPVSRRREWLVRALLVSPILIVLVLLNTPLTLWAYVWDIHVREFEPERFSPLLIWLRFLNGGGRIVMGLSGGVTLIWAASALEKHRKRHQE